MAEEGHGGFVIGDRVSHPSLGEGTIQAVGKDKTVTIAFDSEIVTFYLPYVSELRSGDGRGLHSASPPPTRLPARYLAPPPPSHPRPRSRGGVSDTSLGSAKDSLRARLHSLLGELGQHDRLTSESIRLLDEAGQILGQLPIDEQVAICQKLPPWARKSEAVLCHIRMFSPTTQASLLWPIMGDISEFEWRDLAPSTRILFIYCTIHHQGIIEARRLVSRIGDGGSALVRFVMDIVEASRDTAQSQHVFPSIHSRLQDWILEVTRGSTVPLDLRPVLPDCLPGLVRYCEARPWPKDDEERSDITRVTRAFCPRGTKG